MKRNSWRISSFASSRCGAIVALQRSYERETRGSSRGAELRDARDRTARNPEPDAQSTRMAPIQGRLCPQPVARSNGCSAARPAGRTADSAPRAYEPVAFGSAAESRARARGLTAGRQRFGRVFAGSATGAPPRRCRASRPPPGPAQQPRPSAGAGAARPYLTIEPYRPPPTTRAAGSTPPASRTNSRDAGSLAAYAGSGFHPHRQPRTPACACARLASRTGKADP